MEIKIEAYDYETIQVSGGLGTHYFHYDDDEDNVLAFSDGSVIAAFYDGGDEEWSFRRIAKGVTNCSQPEAKWAHSLVLEGPNLKWVVSSTQFVVGKSSILEAAG